MMELRDANTNLSYLQTTLFGELTGAPDDKERARWNAQAWGWKGDGGANADAKRAVEQLVSPEIGSTSWQKRHFFDALWKRRLEEAGLEAQEPPNSCEFVRLRFTRPVRFESRNIHLKDCVFEEKAAFRMCTIAGPSKAQFNGPVEIRSSGLRRIEFDGAVFGDGAGVELEGMSDQIVFRNCAFHPSKSVKSDSDDLHQLGWQYGVSFAGSSFETRCDFSGSVFHGTANFQDVTFGGLVKFNKARFMQRAIFSHVQFRQFADFFEAEFGSRTDAVHHFTFANATFHEPVSFQGAQFPVRLPVLSGTTLPLTTTVTISKHWPRRGPSWGRTLDEKLGLRKRLDWQPLGEVKASAAALRHAMSRQTLPEEEHFFFRREMYAATRTGKAIPGWFTWLFYELPSDYGGSVLRPVSALLALLFLGAVIFDSHTVMGRSEALGYSFANMFKFFGLHRTYFDAGDIQAWPGWVQWISGVQTVLAFVFLFFLGLGLRTRFRLR